MAHGAFSKAKQQIADKALLKNKFKNEIYTEELIFVANTEATGTLQERSTSIRNHKLKENLKYSKHHINCNNTVQISNMLSY